MGRISKADFYVVVDCLVCKHASLPRLLAEDYGELCADDGEKILEE